MATKPSVGTAARKVGKPAAKTAAAVKVAPRVDPPKVKPAVKPPTFKAPKSLAAAADRCYTLREERLGYSRKAEQLKAEEGFLREFLIERLPKSDAQGITGQLVTATIKADVVPVAEDWSKLYEYLVKSYLDHKKRKTGLHDGVFAVLGRSLTASVVKEMWEQGVKLPGVGRFNTKSVSFSKR